MTFLMNAIAPIVKPVSKMQLALGSLLTIPDVNWQEFEANIRKLGE
ncbi:MAG: hypothetical protein J7647_01845 [Cyanobacteria bacterium SBLK]|nr:hypothetical protein [Cyanobacteria bacterium SBLK]